MDQLIKHSHMQLLVQLITIKIDLEASTDSMDLFLLDAVADILSSITDIELFEFGDGNSNDLKSKNLLEEFKSCSENPSASQHEKKHDGRK